MSSPSPTHSPSRGSRFAGEGDYKLRFVFGIMLTELFKQSNLKWMLIYEKFSETKSPLRGDLEGLIKAAMANLVEALKYEK
jgi:hypothetical protein